MLPTMTQLKSISPQWWGAIAGAVVAGATVFADSRVLGGAAAGAAMFYLARRFSAPCCAACAGDGDVETVSVKDTLAPPPSSSCTDCLDGVFA